MTLSVNFFKLDESAVIPTLATTGSAALDFSALIQEHEVYKGWSPLVKEFPVRAKRYSTGVAIQLYPQTRVLIRTGLIVDLPERAVLRLYIRSSVGIKKGLMLANSVGVIDSDYTDELYIAVMNTTETPIFITHGDRLAQGIVELLPELSIGELSEHPGLKGDRKGGIGSTGS